VAVVADDVSDAELSAMHAAGVRGVRLNLVSPVGEGVDPALRFEALEPRLRRLGWHLQWYAHAEQLPRIAELHGNSDVTCVLDHLAGFHLRIADDHPAWRSVQALALRGAWLKLSGWYRLGVMAPYARLAPRIRRLADLFGPRMVWGSDWPHTTFAPDAMPHYADTWQPVVGALGLEAARALRQRLPPIYS
jgi:predicted TIM-barrel fold metal-dependent hydrolase